MAPPPAGRIAAAFERACLAELGALKPGNVHRFAGGHGMEVEAFEASARVSAPLIGKAGAPVGARVLRAVRATREAVGVNTNLGILLLCAPLAAAAERGGQLQAALAAVLEGLTPGDTADVFRAIALANPGGLGTSEDADVARPPTVGLLEAMRIAAPRDRIARAYGDGFADVFAVALPTIAGARRAGADDAGAALAAYLAVAARFPDSHVARKHGAARAEAVRGRFAELCNRLAANGNPAGHPAMLLALDRELKAEGINPGTSADFAVAGIFAEALADALEDRPIG